MAAQNPTYQLARFLLFLGITLIFSFLSGTAYSANLTLAWDANNEPDLLGYHVFCGESSGNYTINHDITSSDPNDPPPTTCEFTGLEEGKEYFFAAIAYSENGQSDYSQEISYTVPMAQNDPDTDQDGYTTAQGDCNDSDPAVHPGAAEICGDGIDQKCSGADFACPDDRSLIRDAQTGVLSGAFEIGSDPVASSGQYVYVPNGVGTRFDGPDETHKITYTFNLLEEGTYRIKGTVYAANGSDDSFWVKVNDNPAGGYLWDVLQNTGYLQDYVNDRNGADPVEVSLKVGLNTVTVYLREDGTRLGTIELEPVATAAPVADEDGDGYTESQGDCDDNSATVYPGAEDTCGDGIDQDCNGSDLTCVDLTKDSDNDGLTDYEEENTYFTDPNKADTDGDGFSDGEEVAGGFDPNNTESKPDPRTSELPMEFGEIELDHQWKTVTLNRSFDEPVVITGAISYAQQDPAVIRVRNVNHNSFDVRVQEWDYLDGQHATEQVSYIVVESGTHDLAGGARVEAGRFNANAVSSFASIEFSQAFNSVPVVLTTINSVNESDAVVMRLKNITTTGFDYRIQEQESNDKQHAPETAGYIAWEPSAGSMDGFMFEIGRTSNSVTHQFQS
ncbi:MAG: MopE-related protein, partial [Desulfobacterales bacterium]